MATADQTVFYSGAIHGTFGREILRLVNIQAQSAFSFAHFESKQFADGEPNSELTDPERIKGRHVVIYACVIHPVLELELRDMVKASMMQYGAASVTVVLPFLPYRRQDRVDHQHFYEINRLRLFMDDLKHWGASNVVLCEPHSLKNTQRFADEVGLKLFIADPTRLFADTLRPSIQTAGGNEQCCIYAPDLGSVGRALRLSQALGGIQVVATPKVRDAEDRIRMLTDSAAFLDQVHQNFGDDAPVSCDLKNVKGKVVITREDEANSGKTATETAAALRAEGAVTCWLCATHPVCSGQWKDTFWPRGREPAFSAVWFGDTRPRGLGTKSQGSTRKVQTVSMAPVIAEALIQALTTLP